MYLIVNLIDVFSMHHEIFLVFYYLLIEYEQNNQLVHQILDELIYVHHWLNELLRDFLLDQY